MKRHALFVAGLVMLINIAVVSPLASQEKSRSGLVSFEDCDAFLDHVKTEGLSRVGPYGFDSGGSYLVREAVEAAAAEAEAATDAADGAAARVAGVDYSTTNVQEVGVDEPRHDAVVLERVVYLVTAGLQPGAHRLEGPDLDYAAVPDRDRLRDRQGGLHRSHRTGQEDGHLGHRNLPMPSTPAIPSPGARKSIGMAATPSSDQVGDAHPNPRLRDESVRGDLAATRRLRLEHCGAAAHSGLAPVSSKRL